jgi:hypothetical protein
MPRIKTSNCVSCLVWFGTAKGGIQKNAQHIFLKEANAAASQLRSPAGCGGETNKFVRTNEFKRQVKSI